MTPTGRHAVSLAAQRNVNVMLEIFRSIEERQPERFDALSHPDLELHWPPPLPYAGVDRVGMPRTTPGWGATWAPFQPTQRERSLDPRIVAATDDEVVILWRQRGVSPAGDRLDSPVLGLYRLRDGRLERADMFCFDPTSVAAFLVEAARQR